MDFTNCNYQTDLTEILHFIQFFYHGKYLNLIQNKEKHDKLHISIDLNDLIKVFYNNPFYNNYF